MNKKRFEVAANENRKVPPKSRWSGSLPSIHYSQHPAYQNLNNRNYKTYLKAWRMFGKGLFITIIRLITDFEHLPKRPESISRLDWVAAQWPKLTGLVIKRIFSRLFNNNSKLDNDLKVDKIFTKLKCEGVYGFQLERDEKQQLNNLLKPFFAKLERRLDRLSLYEEPKNAKFDDIRLWLDPVKNAGVFDWFNDLMEKKGINAVSSAYLNRPVKVAHITPQINFPGLPFSVHNYSDVGVEDPACNYFHVDTAYNVTKMMIYFNKVNDCNGPFSYISGSHKSEDSFFDRLVRRANDYGGLSKNNDPETRLLFMCLPAILQKKSNVGADLMQPDEQIQKILHCEHKFTSDAADCVLFDPTGMHRGGLVKQGKRYALSILFAEQF